MNVENIIYFDRNIMTYKIMSKLCPGGFLDKYKPRSSFLSYNTRNSQNLQIPMHRTENYIKSFRHSALKDWDDTQINLHELPHLTTFKRARLKVNTIPWKNSSILNRFFTYLLLDYFDYCS